MQALAKEVCWIKWWKWTKSSLEMLWVTIACGGFIHPGLVAYVGSECWLTMPQMLSQPTLWSCVGPLQHNKEEGCSISCLSLHWEWLQSIKAGLSEKAHQSRCEGVRKHSCLKELVGQRKGISILFSAQKGNVKSVAQSKQCMCSSCWEWVTERFI